MNLHKAMVDAGLEVVVLCGGEGGEREVSIRSGAAVAAALQKSTIPVRLVRLDSDSIPDGELDQRSVVLPVVHGHYGEGGRLSADLERLKIPYAGCSVAASAICFDKLACRAMAQAAGIPVARGKLLYLEINYKHVDLADELGLPYVLKPRASGSSCGLHIVRTAEQFDAAQADLAGEDYVAESYAWGMDLTVGILDAEALEVVSIEPVDGAAYDYEHKYTAGMSRYSCPANISEALRTSLRASAARIFRDCGCRDIGRVDFRTTGGPMEDFIFLEVNTLPGMTATSLLPMSAGSMGITFVQLVEKWARLAALRHPLLNGGNCG